MVVILLALRRMSQCVQAEKLGVFFWGLGGKGIFGQNWLSQGHYFPKQGSGELQQDAAHPLGGIDFCCSPPLLLPALCLHFTSTPGIFPLSPSILLIPIYSCLQPLSFLAVVSPSLSVISLSFLCFCVYPRVLLPRRCWSLSLRTLP